MSGKELIDLIENKEYKMRKGRNIMGCCECFYDPNYLVYSAFKDKKRLTDLRNRENIDDLLLIASFAAEVFY